MRSSMRSSKFKRGDKVICISNKHFSRKIQIGSEYTVDRVFYHSIILKELDQYVGQPKSDFEKFDTIRRKKLNRIKNGIRKGGKSSLY